jgi:hypothetical protein
MFIFSSSAFNLFSNREMLLLTLEPTKKNTIGKKQMNAGNPGANEAK